MVAKISNTGELRDFLTMMMVGVKNGDTKIDEARTIVKLAEKVNESYYSELKVAQVNLQLGVKVVELGKLAIK